MTGKTLFLTVSLLTITAQAFGFGSVTTDPVSYTYFAEQITTAGKNLEKTVDLVNKAKDQINNIKEVQNRVSEASSQLKGHYGRGKDLYDSIVSIREDLENTPTSMQAQYEKWKDLDFIDPQKVLDDFFKDPRSVHSDVFEALDRQYEIRQIALKNSIENAEKLLQNAPERLTLMEKLSKQIDGTANIKDATDLSNRILIEMWRTTEEIKTLLANLGEAQSLLDFTGVSKEIIAERKEAIAASSKRKKGPMDDMLILQGQDPNDRSNEALYKALGI